MAALTTPNLFACSPTCLNFRFHGPRQVSCPSLLALILHLFFLLLLNSLVTLSVLVVLLGRLIPCGAVPSAEITNEAIVSAEEDQPQLSAFKKFYTYISDVHNTIIQTSPFCRSLR